MKLSAPSKINLYLRIIKKRSDGYHEIETVFLPLKNPSDTVTLNDSKNEKLRLSCSNPDLPRGRTNLCRKAAEIFAESAKVRPSWKIHIEKNIPISAGLGGGSSDAAAVLNLLKKKYPGKISDSKTDVLAAKLGADVPFFLRAVPSIARGIGEKLTPLEFECKVPVAVIFPKFPVSAEWAYQNRIRNEKKSKIESLLGSLRENDPEKLSSFLCNDLAPALWKKFPVLRILKRALSDMGALGVEICGSGSSLFAVAESADSANKIALEMCNKFKNGILSFSTVAG